MIVRRLSVLQPLTMALLQRLGGIAWGTEGPSSEGTATATTPCARGVGREQNNVM